MINIPGIGQMRLGQAESEIKKIEKELEHTDEAGLKRRLEDSLRDYREGVSKFYRVTSHNRSWI